MGFCGCLFVKEEERREWLASMWLLVVKLGRLSKSQVCAGQFVGSCIFVFGCGFLRQFIVCFAKRLKSGYMKTIQFYGWRK